MTILRFVAGDDATRTQGDDGEQRIAAIDIGSNSIRQIIADVGRNGSIRIVDEMKAAPRLGAGLSETGALGEEPMRLAVESLQRMATLARQLGAKRVEAVATSAVRDAANGALFLSRVRQQTGLKVRVLDGSEEARLAFRSALAHFELGHGRCVVMDIGGGSLELALAAEGLVEHLVSLPFGALRLTEQFLSKGSTPKAIKKLRKHIREEIRAVLPVRDWRGAEVIGSGGTFTNLAGIYLARQGMRAARSVHGTRIPRAEVEHVLDMLAEMTLAERLAVPGLNAGRADIIVAGLAVAAEVLAAQSSAQRRLAVSLARERLLQLGPRLAPQWIAFAAPNIMTLRPAVRPRWTVWLRPVALGALCGALLALLACVAFTGLRPRLAMMPDVEPRLADAARVGPRLHVVCGPQRTAVFRAAFELAAHRLAAGERVLLVDGAARWGLHDVLEREPHWGLLECLAADLPMLGLVQFAGHPGLYLLAHGRHSSAIGWSPLWRKLDEVLPHFGRVVLLLDPQAPAELALGLRGRAVEGWWASPSGRRGRALTEAVSRFGIMFHDLELGDAPEMGLESLAARVAELEPVAGPTVPAPMPEGVRVVGPAVPANPLEPIVLDCDLQVRQRLRFLAWTRRVQAGHRPVASPSSPVAP